MFQAQNEVLHRPHHVLLGLFSVYPAGFRQCLSFASVFVDPTSVFLLDFVVVLNDYSHDSVDPRLRNIIITLILMCSRSQV